jgi:hypothetical protein
MAMNLVPVGNFELTYSRSINITVWALLIVPNVIASNTKNEGDSRHDWFHRREIHCGTEFQENTVAYRC